jgi:predicted metalloprotease with PDZ domain
MAAGRQPAAPFGNRGHASGYFGAMWPEERYGHEDFGLAPWPDPSRVVREPQLGIQGQLVRRVGLELICVDPCGAAARAGLEEGDVLLEVNGRPIRCHNDLSDALRCGRVARIVLIDVRTGRLVYCLVPLSR